PTSLNGITGSWSPAVISTASTGTTTYTFTPDAGQCAEITTLDVEVGTSISATFNSFGPYCTGEIPATLPVVSNNDITGSWSPSSINTASVGTTTYTFTPDAGQCAGPYSMNITVTSGTTPPFGVMGPYCLGSMPGNLPTTALNGVTGTWNPSVINTSVAGTTVYTFTPDAGQCATNATLSIKVNPEYAFDEYHNQCGGSSYTWHGNTYSASGTYTVNYPSMYGCDSTYTLHLTVYPEYEYSENHTICPGSSYTWHENTYSSAGSYYANYTSQQGCDSTYTLNLSIGQEYAFTENHSICEGESYLWHGTTYSAAGTYTAAYSTISGCDSIYTLNLTMNQLPVVWLGNDTTICADTETLTLDAGNPGATYLWSENGATTQSIQFTCSGCNMGVYPVWVTVNNGCSASDTINVNIQLCDIIEESGDLITGVFPNPTDGAVYLSSNNLNEDAAITITNADGKLIFTGMLNDLNSSSGNKEIDLSDYAAGIYFMQIIHKTQVQIVRIVRQ
ncbi:MAG TPA: T9SS type A sorting domain-containing protein, partial [Bacteroidales bacterium]|nr:T9SS type A sorting domain-containing protein [Bacteroidales bacterium]